MFLKLKKWLCRRKMIRELHKVWNEVDGEITAKFEKELDDFIKAWLDGMI